MFQSEVTGRPEAARWILSSLMLAVLAACGGGSGGASSLVTSAAVGGDVTDTSVASASTPEMQALAVTSSTDTSVLAAEGKSFVVSGTQLVRYGAADKWVVKSVSQSGTCSNDFFANDPIYGTVKSCVLIQPIVLAGEGQSFQVSGTMAVRYGAGDKWVTKDVASSGTCSNAYFGKDPVVGAVKSCQLVAASVLANVTGTVATVSLPATENGLFFVLGTQTVRYGANGKWISQTVTGRATCSNAFFGNDPVYGTAKACEVVAGATSAKVADTTISTTPVAAEGSATSTSTTTPVTTATATVAAPSTTATLQPAIDATKLPAAAAGYATARVQAANVADPSQNPVTTDTGAFREACDFSHMSYDDPIVYPGSAGGHLHVFFGNTGTNRNSTATSIAGSGNSTCAGGTANRTAYWMPAMIDTADGTPQKPAGSLFYYKAGYHYVDGKTIKPFPAGLRMIGGNSASSAIQDGGIAGFTCFKPDGTWTNHLNIPTDCAAGSTLTLSIAFPQCWDGVNVDSPDHKSHMAYAGIGCPSTHPVALTEVTMRVNYSVTGVDGTKNWRLASDNYDKSLPGGYSSHADWFGGWNADVVNTWTAKCINAVLDCHAYLLGDGRTLY